MIANTL